MLVVVNLIIKQNAHAIIIEKVICVGCFLIVERNNSFPVPKLMTSKS